MARTCVSGSSKALMIAACWPTASGPIDAKANSASLRTSGFGSVSAADSAGAAEAALGPNWANSAVAAQTRLGTLERFDESRSRRVAHRGHGRKRLVDQLLVPLAEHAGQNRHQLGRIRLQLDQPLESRGLHARVLGLQGLGQSRNRVAAPPRSWARYAPATRRSPFASAHRCWIAAIGARLRPRWRLPGPGGPRQTPPHVRPPCPCRPATVQWTARPWPRRVRFGPTLQAPRGAFPDDHP